MDFFEYFNCLCPEELVLYATALSISISKNLTASQANSFGNFLQTLGQNIETMSAQASLNETSCDCLDKKTGRKA